jgi:large subunit ribosomal protein L20
MKLRHKKVLKAAKGYYGARSRTFRSAQAAIIRAGRYAYRDRKQKKRNFRALWIARINAGVREHDLSYSRFMHGLLRAGIPLNRKVLADIAVADKASFATLVMQAKQALMQTAQPFATVESQTIATEAEQTINLQDVSAENQPASADMTIE